MAWAEAYAQVTEGTGLKLHLVSNTIGGQLVHDEVVKLGEPYLPTYFADSGGVVTTTSLSHPLQIMAGANLKVRIKRIEVAQSGLAGAAATLLMALFRLTSAGTGGGAGLGNSAADPSDAAPGATIMTLPTAKGAEGARLTDWSIALAAAAPITSDSRWVWEASPYRKPIYIPAGVTNGLAFSIRTGVATSTIGISVEYEEASY
jgi:hypothetical protein